MTREELNKKFKCLENLSDEEMMVLCYKSFHENVGYDMIYAITDYIKLKAIEKAKQKTTSLE